jgi:hypothetical protein
VFVKTDSKETVLIVMHLTEFVHQNGLTVLILAVFLSNLDAGVPDKVDLGFTGYQTDFNPKSEYISNDEPGHGASTANTKTNVIAGNPLLFYVHGKSFVEKRIFFCFGK